jgi:subtilisin family serine protease
LHSSSSGRGRHAGSTYTVAQTSTSMAQDRNGHDWKFVRTNSRLILVVLIVAITVMVSHWVSDSRPSVAESLSAGPIGFPRAFPVGPSSSPPSSVKPAAAPASPDPRVAVPEVVTGTDVVPPLVVPDRRPDRRDLQRLVRTTGKYPLVRVEEGIERRAGVDRVVSRRQSVADHLLVTVHVGQSDEEVRAAAQRQGCALRARLSNSRVYLLSFPANGHQDQARMRERLRSENAVFRTVEPDYLCHVTVVSNDPSLTDQWALENAGDAGGVADADIDVPQAWDITTGSRAVTVGVIDSGIDLGHPDLVGNLWSNPGESGVDAGGNDRGSNGVDDDGNGYIDDVRGWDFVRGDNQADDEHFHGTHVSGIIGAVGGNGQGIAGVCWQVSLVPLKFIGANGYGYSSDAISAIRYATATGLDLTNNSWSLGLGTPSEALHDAIAEGADHGIPFIVAAGNSHFDNDLLDSAPATDPSANVVSVLATDRADALASFSNIGQQTVDLGAPGVSILSTLPTYRTTEMDTRGLPSSYGTASGTSMAAPHVAGVCALLKARFPSATGSHLIEPLLVSVDRLSPLSTSCVTGGRLNAAGVLGLTQQPALGLAASTFTEVEGNGDGLANAGELIRLTVEVSNQSLVTAASVTAQVSAAGADPEVTVPQDHAALGSLGARSAMPAEFLIRVANDASEHQAALHIALAADGMPTRQVPLTLPIVVSLTVRGVVRDAQTSLAIPGAVVQLTGHAATASDPTGGYRLASAAGTRDLTVMAPGYLPWSQVLVLTESMEVDVQVHRPDAFVIDLTGSPAVAYGLNERGQVVGGTSNAYGAPFLWQDGQLQVLSHVVGQANAINESGVMVGHSNGSPAELRVDAPPRYLPMLDGGQGSAMAINDDGWVVGACGSSVAGGGAHPCRWSPSGELTDLAPDQAHEMGATGINQDGLVVGWMTVPFPYKRAWRWSDGILTLLPKAWQAPSASCNAMGVNDAGEVAGYGEGEPLAGGGGVPWHTLLWRGDTVHDLGSLDPRLISQAWAINNHGVVVGQSNTLEPFVLHAVYSTVADGMRDLNHRLGVGSGWVLTVAWAINDAGWIVGQGEFHGQPRAFLYQPITATTQRLVRYLTVPEDTVANLDLTGVFASAPVITRTPMQGTATMPTPGLVAYEPIAQRYGSDSFVVRGVDGAGDPLEVVVVVQVLPVNDPPVNTALPTVLGDITNGLLASPGTWNDTADIIPSPISFTWQWQRAQDAAGTGAVDIPGAIGPGYQPGAMDLFVRVVVTAHDEGWPGSSATAVGSAFQLVQTASGALTLTGADISGTVTRDDVELWVDDASVPVTHGVWQTAVNLTEVPTQVRIKVQHQGSQMSRTLVIDQVAMPMESR